MKIWKLEQKIKHLPLVIVFLIVTLFPAFLWYDSAGQKDHSIVPASQKIFSQPLRKFDFEESEIEVRNGVFMEARDGIKLSMDIYIPRTAGKYPTLISRTPYGKNNTDSLFMSMARYGYVVIAQDCRGTGESGQKDWDMYIYEKEDSYDTVEWILSQPWSNGKIGGLGGSYVGETQWFMSFHPSMTAIMPVVAGIGIGESNGIRIHMFLHAYAKTVGRSGGAKKSHINYDVMEQELMDDTLASGFFNDPIEMPPYPEKLLVMYPELREMKLEERGKWMLAKYVDMKPAERADLIKFLLGSGEINILSSNEVPSVFGEEGFGPAFRYVQNSLEDVYHSINAPALMVSGWYDWGLDWTLATWDMIQKHSKKQVREGTYLFITPSAHASIGYREGVEEHPDLSRRYRGKNNLELALKWYDYWLKGRKNSLKGLSRITYYLMGENEWRGADSWPLPSTRFTKFFIDSAGDANEIKGSGSLSTTPPKIGKPDRYVYDPMDPTPTKGGSILSFVIPAGSTNQVEVQKRSDVLVYSSEVLKEDMEVTGPIKMILYASSSSVDTDFAAKLTDVFLDGKALQIQNGMVRARYRYKNFEAELIEPDKIYRYEIDMWATSNMFKKGHRLRLEISSADFPRYERNTNLGGKPGDPIIAVQTIFHDKNCPSHLLLPVIPRKDN